MPSFPTNETGTGRILGRAGEWLADAFDARLVNGRATVRQGDLVVNVRDFGAKGDESTDDTAAIRAAAATLKDGDTLYFPGGTYYVSGTIALDKTVSVEGNTATKTVILNKFGNCSPFTSTADGVWFRDLFMTSYQAMETVHDNQCTAITFLTGKNCGVERCTFSGWYQWVVFENGPAFTLRDNRFGLCSKYGIVVRNAAFPDNGDSSMYGNMFVTNDPWNADALVRQESSGGLRVFGNKFLSSTLGAARFLDVAISDGAATSILVVTGNSFEYPQNSAIRVTTKGPLNTGVFGKVNITGNQFTGNGVNGPVIDFAYPGGSNRLAEVTVAANTMWGHQTFPTGGYVKLAGVDIANITGNQFRGGPLGVDIRSSSRNIMVDKSNMFHEITIPVRGIRIPDKVTFPGDSLLEVDAPRPPAPGLAPSTSGGTLSGGQYRYAVSYRDGSNLLGQLSDISTTTVTGTTGSVVVTWSPWPTTSTVARVYRGLGAGDLTEYRDVSGTTLTDTGTGWTAGTHPQTSSYPAIRLGSMVADPLGSAGRATGWLIGGNWGINTRFPTSDFHVNGSQSVRVESVAAGSGDASISDFARVFLIKGLTANRTIWIPSASGRNGRVITVKDATGQAGTFVASLKANAAGQTINGAAEYLIDAPYEAVELVSDGSNWFSI